ncbi:ChrR family anti-sigma-E factor [Rhizobium sp. CC-YZS058]|uniref:ChrR family anti-sigma-E factor n=1 Tax=Rhizobium sp. CC-YZS058 TaxID=3042153 RepID=UPI002B054C52|nr:ChrR family anti-sigma-E factor [Rhizobium sp. CC-YZS058]MEA3534890.1 ChrR family anti-sigma-E factor [Rhizobium sp. CC-YZS058]
MTRQEFDTVDALLAHYAAGMLPEPVRVLIEAHLEIKPDNRPVVAKYEAAGGDMLDRVEPAALSNRDALLRQILEAPPLTIDLPRAPPSKGAVLPQAIRDFVGRDLDDLAWKTKLPGLKEHVIGKMDGCEVGFFWIRPGRAVPAHTHEGFELSLVLTGAFNDARGRFARGDISVADDGLDHRPVAEEGEPCIVFSVTDAPLKLTGSFRQRLGDLIG